MDWSVIDWPMVATQGLLVFISAFIANLFVVLVGDNRVVAALIAALIFCALLVGWTYYPLGLPDSPAFVSDQNNSLHYRRPACRRHKKSAPDPVRSRGTVTVTLQVRLALRPGAPHVTPTPGPTAPPGAPAPRPRPAGGRSHHGHRPWRSVRSATSRSVRGCTSCTCSKRPLLPLAST